MIKLTEMYLIFRPCESDAKVPLIEVTKCNTFESIGGISGNNLNFE